MQHAHPMRLVFVLRIATRRAPRSIRAWVADASAPRQERADDAHICLCTQSALVDEIAAPVTGQKKKKTLPRLTLDERSAATERGSTKVDNG